MIYPSFLLETLETQQGGGARPSWTSTQTQESCCICWCQLQFRSSPWSFCYIRKVQKKWSFPEHVLLCAGGEDEDPDFQLPSISKVRVPLCSSFQWDFHSIHRISEISTKFNPGHKFNGTTPTLKCSNLHSTYIAFNALSNNHQQQLWVPDFIGLPIFIPLSLLFHVTSLPYLALAPSLPFPALAGLLKRCPEKLLKSLPSPNLSPLPTFAYLPSPFRLTLLPGLPRRMLPSLPLPTFRTFPLLWSASRTLLPWVFPISNLCSSDPQPRWGPARLKTVGISLLQESWELAGEIANSIHSLLPPQYSASMS